MRVVSKKSRRNTLILAIAIIVVGIAFLIAGIILLVKRNGSHCKAQYETSALHKRGVERCSYSEEAKRSGLAAFLRKVQDKAFDVQPFLIAHKPKVTGSEVQLKYKAYDPSPSNLQHVTDTAKSLLRELNDMIINENKLKSRERKALSQLRHFLRHIFGTPFDGNYYFGDYLLGPNVFCWQPICTVGISLGKTLPLFKPSDAQGLEILIEKLTEVNQTFKIYTDNLRYGVRAGMVRSVEECEAGLNSIQRYYFNISFSGPSGVFNEWYMQEILKSEFLTSLENNPDQLNEWREKHAGRTPSESLRESVLEHVGRPIYELLRYLENEHIQHCVPSNVSSGLSFLPVSYVYINGSADVNQKTTKVLPSGEPLNGSKAYAEILSYFTTTNNTPDEVHELGYKMLHKLYPEALEVARQVTGQNDNNTAREQFVKMMNRSEMFFNNVSIPPQESDSNAFKLCSSAEKAKQHCPHRWRAIQQWFTETREVQGHTEHFQDTCGGLISWLSSVTSYTAFVEGWALYAENPLIAYDTDTYEGQPLYKYGMLKSQVWRALRMVVDTGLHYKGLKRDDALKMFQEYLWDDSDITLKEVTRYQSSPGQATSYMIGQLHIIKLRQYAEKKLGKKFNLKDFHFQVLYQGSAPLSFLEESIKEYVDCVLNKTKKGCDEILDPLSPDSQENDSYDDQLGSLDSLERELYF